MWSKLKTSGVKINRGLFSRQYAILYLFIFGVIGTTLLLLSHASINDTGDPNAPLTIIIAGGRIDGSNTPSHNEQQYASLVKPGYTKIRFRTVNSYNFYTGETKYLLNRWKVGGSDPAPYFYTLGASDFPVNSENTPTGTLPLIDQIDDTTFTNIVTDPNCKGLYLHEILAYESKKHTPSGQPTDWWGTLSDQAYIDDLAKIDHYIQLMNRVAPGKKVVWSEPSYDWAYMNSNHNYTGDSLPDDAADSYNPTYTYLNSWGATVVPMFATNFAYQDQTSAAMLSAMLDARARSGGVFGESAQGWTFTDIRPDKLYNNTNYPTSFAIPNKFSYSSSAAYAATSSGSMCENIAYKIHDYDANGNLFNIIPPKQPTADANTVPPCTYNLLNLGYANTATVFQLEGTSDDMNNYDYGGVAGNPSPFMSGVQSFFNDVSTKSVKKIILPIDGTCRTSSTTTYINCTTPSTVTYNKSVPTSTTNIYTKQTISSTSYGGYQTPVAIAASAPPPPQPAPTGGWSTPEILSGLTVGKGGPAAVSRSSGQIDVLATSSGSSVYRDIYNYSSGAGSWGGWNNYGGTTYYGPAVSTWGAGRMDMFAVGTNNQVYQNTYDSSVSNSFTGWQVVPGGSFIATSKPTAVSWGSGRIDLFARGTDNALWHNWYDNGWHSWENLGGGLSSAPSVASWGSGHLDVFVRGTDGAIWHKYFLNSWSGWYSLGGSTDGVAPAAVASGYGHIFVFAVSAGHVYWKAFDNSTGWASDWTYIGLTTGEAPAVASWAQGRLDLFTLDSNSAVNHTFIQLSLNTYTPPPPPPVDTDGDGAPDTSDPCPTQAGPSTNNYCPVHVIPLYHYRYTSLDYRYDNFYTTHRDDAGFASIGYWYVDCPVSVLDGQNPGTVPLWRYYNSIGQDHFYTITRNDAGYAYYGYSLENQEGWVYPPNTSSSLFNLEEYFTGAPLTDHIYIRGVYGSSPSWSYSGYSYDGVAAQVWGPTC